MLPLRVPISLLFIFMISVLCQNAGIREFSYNLEDGRLYSKQIGERGPTFIVGSHYYQVVPGTNKNTLMSCQRMKRIDFRAVYDTTIQMQVDGVPIKLNNTLFNNYFVVVQKEIWKCLANGRIGMSRIVEKLVGREEVSQILYHDGVEITAKPLIGDRRTVHIKEIKYFDQIRSKVWRFDGLIKIIPPKSTDHDHIADFDRSYRYVGRKISGDTFNEMDYGPGTNLQYSFNNVIDTRSSIKIQLISFPSDTYGSATTIADCSKYQGTFPFIHRPKLNVIDSESGTTTTLTQDNYVDYFTPIEEEVWICKDDAGKQFLRLVQEFVSRQYVGEVVYSQEWVALRTVKMLGRKTIRAKSINYATLTCPPEFIKYEGKIRLKTPEHREIKVMKSSNNRVAVEMREIEYVLEPGRIYKSFVGIKGINVRVGTGWTRSIGNQDDVVNCHLLPREADDSLDYGTKFRLCMRTKNVDYTKAIPRSRHYKYWKFVKQEIWMCQKNEEYKFLRIVNELEGVRALLQVEYYDTIQLYTRTLDERESSVNLVEIKYLDHNNFEPLKYDGKLLLKNPPESSHNFIDCLNCDGQPIRKTENEIFLESSHQKPVFSYLERANGINANPDDNRWSSYDWDRYMKPIICLGIGVSPLAELVGNANDILECAVTNEKMKAFDVYLETATGAGSTFKAATQQVFDEWINMISQQVWECRRNGEFKFFRVVNTFQTNKKFGRLFYKNGLTMTTPNSNNVMDFQEIKQINSDGKSVRYVGSMELIPRPDDYDVVRSGTVIIKTNNGVYSDPAATDELRHSQGRQSIYNLDFERFHQIKLRESGRSVEIGQKWTDEMNTDKPVKCEKQKDFSIYDFKKDYITKCTYLPKGDGNSGADVTICFDTYFDLINWEVWDCKNDGKIVFRRIVNYFELKPWDSKSEVQPIKEVKHHDGVWIGSGKYAHGVEGWTFKQVKYVSHQNVHKIYKYDGKLILNENDIDARPINAFLDTNTKSCLFNVAARSMHYLLNHDAMAYKTTLKPSGMTLKIDSRYEKSSSFGNLLCEKQSETDTKYAMKVFVGVKDGSFFKFKELITADYISRLSMSWKCTLFENDGAGDIKLIRVINRLEVRKDIAQVIHYDGVTVTKGESVIEEIKYIDPSDGKVTKFEGSIVVSSSLYEYDIIQSPRNDREIEYILDKQLVHVRKFKEDGKFIEYGTQWTRVFADSSHKIRCDLSKQLPYLVAYIPEVYSPTEVNQVSVKKELSWAELNSIFKVLTNDAVNCISSQYGDITRVVNKIETKEEDIAEIFYPDGVTIWKKNTAGAGSIIIREVKYVIVNVKLATAEVLKFDGEVEYSNFKSVNEFSEGTSVEDIRALSSEEYNKEVEMQQNWHKDLKKWEKDHEGNEPLENIIFTPRVQHLTNIQPFVGLSIEIGQKWTKEIGSVDDTFKCKIDSTKYDSKSLMPKITIDLGQDKITLDEDTIDDYFNLEKREIYKCVKDSESFLKVVTELSGKSGVRQVLHQDGVKVMRHPIGLNVMTARIIEQRYLDPNDFTVLKFAGKLEKE